MTALTSEGDERMAWQIGASLPRLIGTLCLMTLLAGCTQTVEIHSGLAEADANELVVALSRAGIESEKTQRKLGFSVHIAATQLPEAVAALRAQGLPRHAFARMGEVFKKDGMISTPMEERGRYLFALSQELESTLSQIDGVVLARVHPVLPERPLPGEPAQASSCAVFIKHRPDLDPALYEERVRQLVASSIPGLSQSARSSITVVFAPASTSHASPVAPALTSPSRQSRQSSTAAIVGAIAGVGITALVAITLLGWTWAAHAFDRLRRSARDPASSS